MHSCPATQEIEKKNSPNPQKTKWKWNADTAFITCRAKSTVANQQDKVTSHISVWISCSLLMNKITYSVDLFPPLFVRVTRSLDSSASGSQQIFLPSPILQILIQFSLPCFSTSLTRGYLLLRLGDMHALTLGNKFYVKRTHREKRVSRDSCNLSPPYSALSSPFPSSFVWLHHFNLQMIFTGYAKRYSIKANNQRTV